MIYSLDNLITDYENMTQRPEVNSQIWASKKSKAVPITGIGGL
jgi:hypothetical protein